MSAGKKRARQYPNGKKSAAHCLLIGLIGLISLISCAAPTYISGMTGYTKLALRYR